MKKFIIGILSLYSFSLFALDIDFHVVHKMMEPQAIDSSGILLSNNKIFKGKAYNQGLNVVIENLETKEKLKEIAEAVVFKGVKKEDIKLVSSWSKEKNKVFEFNGINYKVYQVDESESRNLYIESNGTKQLLESCRGVVISGDYTSCGDDGQGAYDFIAGDFDGDGKIDLLFKYQVKYSYYTFKVYLSKDAGKDKSLKLFKEIDKYGC